MSDQDQNGSDKSGSDEGGATRPKNVPSRESTLSGKPAPRIPSTSGITFDIFGQTDVGLVREHNEDNFMAANLAEEGQRIGDGERITGTLTEAGAVLAVCDGMGGAAAGEVASGMAVESLHEMMQVAGDPMDRDTFARCLVRGVEDTGAAIFAEAKRDRARRGMGTTATVAGLIDKVLFVGQVGDSRCYVLRNNTLCLLTKDQSLVNQLIEAGQLTEEEAEAFEHSNIILQALGTTERVAVDLTFVELRRGDRLLLCSDGLCGFVHDDVIEETMIEIKSLPQLAARLIELANGAGGHDNITCVVADFGGDDLETAKDAPVPFYQQYPLPLSEGGGSTPSPVIRSMAPRPMAASHRASAAPGDASSHAFSGWTSAAVLLMFGLAATIALSAGRTPAATPYATNEDSEGLNLGSIPVEVWVRSEVSSAALFVNGQNYGPLSNDEPILLELLPGSYRLEARNAGDVHAVQRLDVRPGLRAEVHLGANPKTLSPDP